MMMSPQSVHPENVWHCRLAILMLMVLIPLHASSFAHTFPTNHRKFTLKPPFKELHKYYNYSTIRRNQQRSDDDVRNGLEEEAAKLRRKAEELRSQIRDMESKLGNDRFARRPLPQPPLSTDNNDGSNKKSLKNKRILIVGANGRFGSMVTRHLLRSHPEVKEVVAAVHYVGQATTRGYGRLSYEVGAEDGKGTIGAAWDEESSNASIMFDPQVMSNYNLDKLRIVEVELLNPTQVQTIIDNVDSIIFCATDFDGNRPRSIALLNAALLFRAVANPTKGRVEIEGLRNCLEGLVADMNKRRWREERRSNEPGATIIPSTSKKNGQPTQFVLISTCPDGFGTFETPYGEFNGLKRQGERLVMEDFPSISYTVLQMGKYDDNFVPEGQQLQYAMAIEDTAVVDGVVTAIKQGVTGGGTIVKDGMQKRINRRDAARAAVDALLSEDIEGKKVQVYTAVRQSDIW